MSARGKRLPKEVRPLLKAAKKAGCELVNCRDGILVRTPDGEATTMIHASRGVSGGRNLQNLKAQLRGMGVEV